MRSTIRWSNWWWCWWTPAIGCKIQKKHSPFWMRCPSVCFGFDVRASYSSDFNSFWLVATVAIALLGINERELSSKLSILSTDDAHFNNINEAINASIDQINPDSMRGRFKQSHANVLLSDLRNWVCKDAMLKARFLKWFELECNTNWLFMAPALVWNCRRSNHDQASRIWSDWLDLGKDGIEWEQSTHDGHQIVDSNV